MCVCDSQPASVLVHKNRSTGYLDMRLQLPDASFIGFVEHGVVSLGTVLVLCEPLGALGLNDRFSPKLLEIISELEKSPILGDGIGGQI